MKHWQKFVATATIVGGTFSLTLPVGAREIVAQLSQGSSCQQVSAEGSGLYVRSQPTVYSDARAILFDGQRLTLGNSGTEHWVEIVAPLPGYVFRGFLAPCQSPVASNCRQVYQARGIAVRQEPSLQSAVLGVVYPDVDLAIAAGENSDWVATTQPFVGYVEAEALVACS